MDRRVLSPRRASTLRLAERSGWAACLVLPVALLHARAVAEILIVVIDVLFLAHAWMARDWAWLRRPFTVAAAIWWLWLVVCSLAGAGLALGSASVRLPLLAVALGWWLLPDPRRQRIMFALLTAGFVWIAIESWQQHLTGHNLFGHTRWGDGALTGPFNKPRAGPAFILLFFPVVVPSALALFDSAAVWRRLAGLAAVALCVVTTLLIGQRMPTLLMVLGLVMTALLLPRLRPAVLMAALAGTLALAALPVLSPSANTKLVTQTGGQLAHFRDSDYGLIFAHAAEIAWRHPWTGLGFDGFRHECASEALAPRAVALATAEATTAQRRACNLHPHNYYLEAADNAGLPGLAAFVGLVVAALASLGHGLWWRPDRHRVGVFVAVLVALFPAASTSAFTSMPNGGWVFLLLGLGLALAGNAGCAASFAEGATRDGRT